jgi:hypothetical protein
LVPRDLKAPRDLKVSRVYKARQVSKDQEEFRVFKVYKDFAAM